MRLILDSFINCHFSWILDITRCKTWVVFFTIIFDEWSCTREHYIALYASWTNAQEIVIRRLIACGVQPLPDVLHGETGEDFGFTAEDIGDYMSYVLQIYDKSFINIECIIVDLPTSNVNGFIRKRISEELFPCLVTRPTRSIWQWRSYMVQRQNMYSWFYGGSVAEIALLYEFSLQRNWCVVNFFFLRKTFFKSYCISNIYCTSRA